MPALLPNVLRTDQPHRILENQRQQQQPKNYICCLRKRFHLYPYINRPPPTTEKIIIAGDNTSYADVVDPTTSITHSANTAKTNTALSNPTIGENTFSSPSTTTTLTLGTDLIQSCRDCERAFSLHIGLAHPSY
ncbi:unnamed protein product [Dibothriocephalus latus]|uniref:Uncharacterized protein n=1 Tax=Dibothriocephalus latus TaxID=60516 RepID=A0A3P7Q919_DIBLA|nr:unnamed protein product [Dibothriocephalus latus]